MQLDDQLSLDEATKFIASRIKDKNDTQRTAEDRIRKRVSYATNSGKLQRGKDGLYRFAYLLVWAREKYGEEHFIDYPFVAFGQPTARLCINVYEAYHPPGDLASCQEALSAMHKEVEQLKAQVDALTPDAHRWRALCEKNKKSASQIRNIAEKKP